MDRIVTSINQIELSQHERKSGSQDIINEALSQMHHQPIQFTIAGVFVINLSLVSSIFTGVATYLVILMQFYTKPNK